MPPPRRGMVALAMGKMGAGELNYSSDIDLICLFDETRYPEAVPEARAAFIRVTRRMTALLSDVTAERLCLSHRPAPAPRCGGHARSACRWPRPRPITRRRAAPGNARPISRRGPAAGDLAAGERFLKALTPFVWRKHLDFAAIQDAHDMRLRIRDHRGLHGPLQVEGHNMKLGAGRHPRDRVLHPDPPADRRGPRPRPARPHHGGRPCGAGREGLDSGRGGRRTDRPLPRPPRGRAPPADGERRPDPRHARHGRGWSPASRTSAGASDVAAFRAGPARRG